MARLSPRRPRVLLGALSLSALLLGVAACTRSSIESTGSLLDFDEKTDPVPVVTISSSGFQPRVSHVDRSVVVKLVNADSVSHRLIAAPELGYGDCPEMAKVSTLAPGESGTIVVERNGLCAYRDESQGASQAFQGILVVH